MNLQVPFQQVDVFTDSPFKGNPVAVVLDGNQLSTEEMQAIANWTNLSETTFVCEPTNSQADYKLRIFTPNNELPFAGHPTLGSAFAILRSGFKPKNSGYFIQECGLGLVTVLLDGDKIFFKLPEPEMKPIDHNDLQQLAKALGIHSNHVKASFTIDIGAVWMTLQLTDSEMVRSVHPNMEELASLTPSGVLGVTVFGATPIKSDTKFEVRSFAPSEGVPEDPVCGSGNGCIAAMVRRLKLTDQSNYVAAQGHAMGRNGRIEVRFLENEEILVGGNVVTCIEGKLNT